MSSNLITCVHGCGTVTNKKFPLVPTSTESALRIACDECFRKLPVETVANPDLPDYLRGSQSQMHAYARSVRYLRETGECPDYFWRCHEVKVTD